MAGLRAEARGIGGGTDLRQGEAEGAAVDQADVLAERLCRQTLDGMDLHPLLGKQTVADPEYRDLLHAVQSLRRLLHSGFSMDRLEQGSSEGLDLRQAGRD